MKNCVWAGYYSILLGRGATHIQMQFLRVPSVFSLEGSYNLRDFTLFIPSLRDIVPLTITLPSLDRSCCSGWNYRRHCPPHIWPLSGQTPEILSCFTSVGIEPWTPGEKSTTYHWAVLANQYRAVWLIYFLSLSKRILSTKKGLTMRMLFNR